MATKRRRNRTRKRKGKVKVTQKAKIRQKNDSSKIDSVQGRLPADVGLNFMVKIKPKKH